MKKTASQKPRKQYIISIFRIVNVREYFLCYKKSSSSLTMLAFTIIHIFWDFKLLFLF